MKSYKVYLESTAWICEANLVGTSRIYRYIVKNGHEIVKNPTKADFIIINSCGLTNFRRNLSINFFQNFYSQKKDNASIIMFGCLIKINKELINSLDLIPIDFNEISKFDEIFYNKIKFEEINPICDDITKQKLLQGKDIFQFTRIIPFLFSGLFFPFSKKIRFNYKKMISSITYENKMFIEIACGCTGSCSYCMIKKARGNICSRKINDIINDIENNYDSTNNLFLVADDCGSYGIDIKKNFFNLIYKIYERFPNIIIDLNYLNPIWLLRYSDDYINLFSSANINLASIPVQSGSNKILKKMNRKYDISEVTNLIKKIKQVSPKTITYTHFLIGFPGEKTSDFLKSLYCSSYFDLPIPLIYSKHRDAVSSSLPHPKSSITISIRYAFFIFFINFIIFWNLLSYSEK
jgi:ribosomal protein S12 methylthiotransferase